MKKRSEETDDINEVSVTNYDTFFQGMLVMFLYSSIILISCYGNLGSFFVQFGG